MRKLLHKIYIKMLRSFEHVGRARAARELMLMGRYEEAQQLIKGGRYNAN